MEDALERSARLLPLRVFGDALPPREAEFAKGIGVAQVQRLPNDRRTGNLLDHLGDPCAPPTGVAEDQQRVSGVEVVPLRQTTEPVVGDGCAGAEQEGRHGEI